MWLWDLAVGGYEDGGALPLCDVVRNEKVTSTNDPLVQNEDVLHYPWNLIILIQSHYAQEFFPKINHHLTNQRLPLPSSVEIMRAAAGCLNQDLQD
jgi:hypothetical protein